MIRPALEADRVTKTFGSFTAVESASFRVEPGEIAAVLGPNGSGKTTLLKMIRGLLRPTSGRILIRGADIASRPEAAQAVGYMSQRFSLYPLLTGIENLSFFGGISGLRPAAVRQALAEAERRVPPDILRRRTKDIPPGYRQAVALVACLMGRPEIVLLDEPTSGVGPDIRRSVWLEIGTLKKEGHTVLVTTHDLREAAYADRILVIDRGRIVVDLPNRRPPGGAGEDIEGIYRESVRHAARD